MAGKARASAITTKPSDRHAISNSGARQREGIDISVGIPGGEPRVTTQGGRRESCVGRLGVGRMVLSRMVLGLLLLLLLLLQMGLL